MKAFSSLKKLPGINNKNVRLAVMLFLALLAVVIIYVIQVSPLSGGDGGQKDNGNLDTGNANKSTISDIVNTAPASKPAASVPTTGATVANNESGESRPTIINGNTNTKTVDPQIQQLQDQDRQKRLKAGYDAYSAKAVSGGGGNSTKSDSSNAVALNSSKPTTVNSESSSDTTNSPYLEADLVKPKSPYIVQAGSIIPAVMISGLNSDISGQVIAQVRENVYDSISGQYLLIPQGSRLVGQFSNQVAYGQQRLAVAWQRVLYPNGYSISLKGMPGSDVAGFSGFYDQVDNHYWALFGSSFVMGVITAGMQYSQNSTNTSSQITDGYAPSVGQTMASSLGQQLGQTGMMITQKQLNTAPTITVRQGYKFTIMLTADIVLKPYKQGM